MGLMAGSEAVFSNKQVIKVCTSRKAARADAANEEESAANTKMGHSWCQLVGETSGL